MDKSWMQIRDRRLPEYRNGVQRFLDFAFEHAALRDKILCPCVKCNNCKTRSREDAKADLLIHGITQDYTEWDLHGENADELPCAIVNSDEESDGEEMQEILRDHFGEQDPEEPNEDATKFFELLRKSEQKLYPNCKKYSKLSFLVKLFHLKCLGGLSNKIFTMLLKLLNDAFPEIELPNSCYGARKIIRDLGLHYIKIDACINDCMLFWKENSKANNCIVCGASRWKHDDGKKIASKILRYFPIIPRLKRLFMSTKTASEMTWHYDKRVNDGLLRHPADSNAWKSFDQVHEWFASEPRNVRLGLASDGFNPFGNMSTQYSIWPVVLIPYNLPPWMCMKDSYFMLSLIIPGPKSPGNSIDVYLQPLIDDLKELWEVGIETFDASQKQNFRMHAAVLWTINDFPAYGNLSGWNTRGALACPSCHEKTQSFYLNNGRKYCFLGHRRFIPFRHRWRRDTQLFDGKKDLGHPPLQLSGPDVLAQVHKLEGLPLGKLTRKRRRNELNDDSKTNWLKKSIFFELPYWKTVLLRHNLDAMHIEKNVCDNVLSTLMNVHGKSKDNLNSRLDLEILGIRKELHPIRRGERFSLPVACYTLSNDEKVVLCNFLKNVKVPDGYSSNIGRCVNIKDRKIFGLKSHDCHVLLECFLPLALRGLLPKHVRDALIELCGFFKELCSKVLSMENLDQIESKIARTLCKLEMIFPPSFFDIMVHLPIHLTSEAKIAGPVQYRWMYPVER